MSKFAIGEQVENVAKITSWPRLLECFRPLTEASDMPSTPKVTAHSSSSPRKAAFRRYEAGGDMTAVQRCKRSPRPPLTDGDSDAARIRHQLDAWANALHRMPQISGNIPRRTSGSKHRQGARADKERQLRRFGGRCTEGRRGRRWPILQDRQEQGNGGQAAAAAGEPETPMRRLGSPQSPTVFAVPEAVPADAGTRCTSRAFARLQRWRWRRSLPILQSRAWPRYSPVIRSRSWRSSLPWSRQLVIAGWLAAHWRWTNWKMRFVVVALVAGLALVDAAGVSGKLVEAHVSVAAMSRSGVTERIEALDACVRAVRRLVADLDGRIAQIDRAVDGLARLGRVTRAINSATQQRVPRDGPERNGRRRRQRWSGWSRTRSAGRRTSRIEASAGPIEYLAMMVGVAPKSRCDG